MKKILLIFEGSNFSEGAFEFASRMNEANPVLLTGMFFSNVSYLSLWSYSTGMAGPPVLPVETEEGLIEQNIEKFKTLCEQRNISCRVHKDEGFALSKLKKESRFADLMVLGSEKFFKDLLGVNPSDYMNEVLHSAECPVLIVPEKFRYPERTILAYDGSESSVYAIKQFAYLFPEWASNETLLIFTGSDTETDLPAESYIEELVRQHFSDLHLLKLHFNQGKELNEWLKRNEKTIVVSGSYGRSSFSLILRKSFVSDVIAEHEIPVFIAHQ